MPTDPQWPTGKAERVAGQAVGELGTGDRRFERGGGRRFVDVHGVPCREVDEDRAVAQWRADPAVATGAHRDLEPASAGQADGGDHVVVGRHLDDRLGEAVRLQGVPDHVPAGLLVGGIAAPDDGAFEVVGHGDIPFRSRRVS